MLFYGRRRYVKLLIPQLLMMRRYPQNHALVFHNANRHRVLSQVIVAVNTNEAGDVMYLDQFIDGDFFVRSQHTDVGNTVYGYCNILEKLKMNNTISPTFILKIDDDVIYIHKFAFWNLLKFKIDNPFILIVSANVINHNGLFAVHARTGIFLNTNITQLNVFSKDPAYLQHQLFLSKLKNGSEMETYNTGILMRKGMTKHSELTVLSSIPTIFLTIINRV